MSSTSRGVSYYFFDFDDNIMFLPTPIFVVNTRTNQETAVGTGEFATIQPSLGRPGKWEDFRIDAKTSFRNFRDLPPGLLQPGQKQPFVADVEKAVLSGDGWRGPSWRLFVYACEKQRSVSIITARGHSRQTLADGVRALVQKGVLPREPNYHTVFPVGNDDVRRELGDERLEMTTPLLKKLAIVKSVEKAVEQHGDAAELRFGMSDDDPQNVNLIVRAMCECKKKHVAKRFFAINTHFEEEVKLEVFPVDYAVTRRPEKEPGDLLE